jgi:antitoxin (DNA-binding transcriptional repressor) of toxin-antitoxin stability system
MDDTVRITELKSRLSEYLRRVRRGARLTVPDRDTAIARLEPVASGAALTVHRTALDERKPPRVGNGYGSLCRRDWDLHGRPPARE